MDKAHAQDKKRLNWREACELLGCSKSYFYFLVNKGLLPAYRLRSGNRGMRVLEEDCKKLIGHVCVKSNS